MSDNKYDTIIREVNGHFYAICQTFNIVIEGKDVTSTYEELQTLRENIRGRYKKLHMTLPDSMWVVNKAQRQGSMFSNTAFGIVSILMFLMCSALMIPVMKISQVFGKLQQVTEQYQPALSNPAIIPKIISNIANTVQEVTPQRKAELHENLKTIIKEVAPFVDEIRFLLIEPKNEQSE